MALLVLQDEQDFFQMMNKWWAGVSTNQPMPTYTAPEMPEEVVTAVAKNILREKGYRVSSSKALAAFCVSNKIRVNTKGKDNRYNSSDLNRIPSKK